ncbi:MAG: ribosome biogenesis GTPase Der [Proteobacteria bacterium]|nr:ribosome biogenesis GTPase Der [Pseudomonadota bacterium]MCL2307008.1 ribosome biogenesis GTPase Der [Pseudomonadota bacterium]
MLPTIALVGRPNVGKSTLFNRLTRSRAALVADFPGLTRDRHYGQAHWGGRAFLVIDTGGFEPVVKDGILREMARQTEQAIAEADLVVFLVDAREGVAAQDHIIADKLRRSGRPVLLAVNKAEGLQRERAASDFHELALGEPYPISSAHGDRVRELIDEALDLIGVPYPDDAESEDDEAWDEAPPSSPAATEADEAACADLEKSPVKPIKVAIVGRPNVGKSTLINALLGEERVIAFDQPGTTRDSIYLDFNYQGQPYMLIDTAGVRRRGKVTETVEKFSVIKTLQAIEDANVVILLLDAQQNVSEQDAHIASYILEAGRALVVGINKWDGLTADQRETVKRDFDRKLGFLSFARHLHLSALNAQGMPALMKAVRAAYDAATRKLPTPRLTRLLQQAVERQQPPRAGGGRPKLRYAHQGGSNPPIIVIHGSALDSIPQNYVRYLEHFFSEAFQLEGTPLRIQFKTGKNPYAVSKR